MARNILHFNMISVWSFPFVCIYKRNVLIGFWRWSVLYIIITKVFCFSLWRRFDTLSFEKKYIQLTVLTYFKNFSSKHLTHVQCMGGYTSYQFFAVEKFVMLFTLHTFLVYTFYHFFRTPTHFVIWLLANCFSFFYKVYL